MFGLRSKSSNATAIRWPELHALLEDDDRRAAIAHDYPADHHESFLVGLRRVSPETAEELMSAGRQLNTAGPLSHCPTIAVAGMLNSGKTSLVSVFLSEQGRARSLRGETNDQGTHRFVLWLPSTWRADAELWSMLVQRVGDALGQPPEFLADDPAVAHQQYNNAEGDESALAVPLIATDAGLDRIGVGLLDCPDIVSDASFGRGAPEQRRELLRKAAAICSAFVVVTGAESIRDTTLSDLLRIAAELMPGVPRFLAVNKVRPRQTPDSVYVNSKELLESHRIDDLYAAYDFDVPASEPFIPKVDGQSSIDLHGQLPTFFQVSGDPDDNPPAAIPETQLRSRLLTSLPQSLDHSELFEQVRLALESRVRQLIWKDGVEGLQQASRENLNCIDHVRDDLLGAVLEFFAKKQPGGKITELRLHHSESIILQLSEAFAKAAPWYARFGMRLNSRIRRLWGGAGELIGRFTPSRIAQDTAAGIRQKFRDGKQGSLLTAPRLSDAVLARLAITDLPAASTEDQLQEQCDHAIHRFLAEDYTSLDEGRLQEAAAEVWSNMPVAKKVKAGLTPLAILFAAFGAALMVPIDFGGSGVILAASFKELLVAAGVSVAGAAWGGGLSIVDVERQAAIQQISNFLAVICDAFGIPRYETRKAPTIHVAERPLKLPVPTIDSQVQVEKTMRRWTVRDSFLEELEQHVRQS